MFRYRGEIATDDNSRHVGLSTRSKRSEFSLKLVWTISLQRIEKNCMKTFSNLRILLFLQTP